MCCNICTAKISEMNDIDMLLSKGENESVMNFSLPILHSYIHFFLMYITYFLQIGFQEMEGKNLKMIKFVLFNITYQCT